MSTYYDQGEGAGTAAASYFDVQPQPEQEQEEQQGPATARILTYEETQQCQYQYQQQGYAMPPPPPPPPPPMYSGFTAVESAFEPQPYAVHEAGVPAAAASAAGRIPDEASSAEKVWIDDIEAEIEKRRNILAEAARRREESTQLLERSRVMISPNMSPAVKELLNRIGGNPAGPAAAAPTLRATSASPILTTPGRAHYGVVPPQPASAAARGTLNIVNAALRDVNQTLQQEAERLQSELHQMAGLLDSERLRGEDLREEMGRLAASEAGLRAQTEALQRTCAELQAALEGRDRSNGELEGTVRALEQELAAAAARIAEVQAALEASNARLAELSQSQHTVEFLKGELERRNNDYWELHGTCLSAAANAEGLQAALAAKDEELARMRAELEAAQAQAQAQAQEQQQPGGAEAGAAEEQIAWYQSELESLRVQLEQAQQQQPLPEGAGAGVADEQVAWYQNELESLRAQLEQTQAQAQAQQPGAEVGGTDEQVAWYQSENAQLRAQLEEAQQQLQLHHQQQQQQQPPPPTPTEGGAGGGATPEQLAWYQSELALRDERLQAMQDSWAAFEEEAAQRLQGEREAWAAQQAEATGALRADAEQARLEAEALRQQVTLLSQMDEQQGGLAAAAQQQQQLAVRVAELEAALAEQQAAAQAGAEEVGRLTEINRSLLERFQREFPAPPPPPGPPPTGAAAAAAYSSMGDQAAAVASPASEGPMAGSAGGAAPETPVSDTIAAVEAIAPFIADEDKRAQFSRLVGILERYEEKAEELAEKVAYWATECERLRGESDRLHAALEAERAHGEAQLEEQEVRHLQQQAAYEEELLRLQGEAATSSAEYVHARQLACAQVMFKVTSNIQRRLEAKAPQRAFLRWLTASHRAVRTELAEAKAALARGGGGGGGAAAGAVSSSSSSAEDLLELKAENDTLRRELAQAEAASMAAAEAAAAAVATQQTAGSSGGGLLSMRTVFAGAVAVAGVVINKAIAGPANGSHLSCIIDPPAAVM